MLQFHASLTGQKLQRKHYTGILRRFRVLLAETWIIISVIRGICTWPFSESQFRAMISYLEFTWHDELWSVHSDEGVHAAEEEDGQDDGEVTDELPHLQVEEVNKRFDCAFVF